MVLIFLVLSPMLAYLCKQRTGRFFNYGTLYVLIWGLTGFLINTGLYGIYKPSFFVNIVMLLGMLTFAMTYVGLARSEVVPASKVQGMNATVKHKTIIVANVIVLIFMLPYVVTSLGIIASKGYSYLRAINYTAENITGRSTLINLMLQDVCFPVIFVTIVIGSIFFFLERKQSYLYLILGGINLVIYELINAARNGYVIAIIIILFAYFKIKALQFSTKIKIKGMLRSFLITIAVTALVFEIIYVTSQRSLGGKSIFETFYYYFFAGPSYLTQLLEHMSEYKVGTDLFWGSGSFGFIYNIIANVGNSILHFNIFNTGYVLNSYLSNVYYYVSNSTRINAMATCYFPFLMDFGYFGMILGPFGVALASALIKKNVILKNNIRMHVLDIFWLYVIYRTIFKWELISMASFFIFLFIIVFTTKDITEVQE